MPVADQTDPTKVAYFTADVVSYSDYLPFGQIMPNRHGDENQYRYGFNGKEKLDELHDNSGDSYDFGARILDVRLGRWLSVDPLESKNAHQSPYNYTENNPIFFKDPDGKDAIGTIQGNTITISATLLVYNEGKNKIDIVKMQKAINKYYGPKSVVIDGKTYNVKFDIQVKEISKKDLKKKTQPGENYVQPMSENYRSDVTDKKYGKFATNQYDDATYAHEVGHMLGLGDQYYEYKAKGVNPVNGINDKKTYVENLPNNSSNEIMGKASADPNGNAELTEKDVKALAEFVLDNNKNGKAIISQKNIWETSKYTSTALRRKEGDTFIIDCNLGNSNYEIITHDKTTPSKKTKKP